MSYTSPAAAKGTMPPKAAKTPDCSTHIIHANKGKLLNNRGKSFNNDGESLNNEGKLLNDKGMSLNNKSKLLWAMAMVG